MHSAETPRYKAKMHFLTPYLKREGRFRKTAAGSPPRVPYWALRELRFPTAVRAEQILETHEF